MGRVLLILSVIFVFLGITSSVKTYDSYQSYKSLVTKKSSMPMTSAAAALFKRAVSFSGEAHASSIPIRMAKSQTELPQRGTKEFEKYEEFQIDALTTFLCYFCGYAALYIARRLAFEWQGSSV